MTIIDDTLQDTSSDSYISDDIISWYRAINYDMFQPLKWQIPLLQVLNDAVAGKVS